jgi:AraC family transcriptional regulator of adaptative response / DNA-3-methyladenine glycosylase II
MLSFLSRRAIPGMEVVSGNRYSRTVAIGGDAGILSVTPAARDRLTVEVRFPRLSALPMILARVRRVFDLAADPVMIGQHLAADPTLKPLLQARPGLRVPGAWDGFELAVRAILGQQITVPAAVKLCGKLVAAWGEPLPDAFRAEALTLAFPRPERLAGADLSVLGMPRARAEALSSLAQSVAGDPDLFGPRRSLEEAIERLRALPGIGEWTAQYIAMRELREPDAFPAADVGLLRAFAGPNGARPTPAELLERAERWRPFRAYAALHLWAADSAVAAGSPAEKAKEKERSHDRRVA